MNTIISPLLIDRMAEYGVGPPEVPTTCPFHPDMDPETHRWRLISRRAARKVMWVCVARLLETSRTWDMNRRVVKSSRDLTGSFVKSSPNRSLATKVDTVLTTLENYTEILGDQLGNGAAVEPAWIKRLQKVRLESGRIIKRLQAKVEPKGEEA